MADDGANTEQRTYSGQLRLRMPVTLHEQVAQDEMVSSMWDRLLNP